MSDIFTYHKQNMELFWRCMAERHSIYKQKSILDNPEPWTEDPIYKSFKFTNICRELDVGTKFVTHTIDKYVKDSKQYLFNVMVYRLFNKIETVDYILKHYPHALSYDSYNSGIVEKLVREYSKESGESVWTNAFIVTGFSNLPKKWDKITRVCHALQVLSNNIIKDYTSLTTMEEAYEWVKKQLGFGTFLAYQVAVDLSYGDWFPFSEDGFVVCGPGCKRGLDRLFPEKVVKEYSYESLNFWLRDQQYEFYKEYDIDFEALFDDREYPYLTVMSIENLLCEFSKYMKVYNKEGRPRNKYIQEHGSISNKCTKQLSITSAYNVYQKINMNQTVWSTSI